MKQLLTGSLLLFFVLSAQSAELTKVSEGDRFHIALGSYLLTNSETEINLSSPSLLGVSINTANDLGMDRRTNVARIDGFYRFTPAHAFEFTWYDIRRRGAKIISREIDWNGETFPIGAQIDSQLDTEIFKLAYNYSFYHNEKVELGIGGGLHIMQIKTGLAGQTNNGSNGNFSTSLTAPLPVLNARLRYQITENFSYNLSLDFFALDFEDYSGTFSDLDFRLLYQLTKHFGIGGGINNNNLNLKEDRNGYKLELNNSVTGATLFLTMNY